MSPSLLASTYTVSGALLRLYEWFTFDITTTVSADTSLTDGSCTRPLVRKLWASSALRDFSCLRVVKLVLNTKHSWMSEASTHGHKPLSWTQSLARSVKRSMPIVFVFSS